MVSGTLGRPVLRSLKKRGKTRLTHPFNVGMHEQRMPTLTSIDDHMAAMGFSQVTSSAIEMAYSD